MAGPQRPAAGIGARHVRADGAWRRLSWGQTRLELGRIAQAAALPAGELALSEPPDADAGLIMDKGYLNQGAVLRHRAAAVRWRLYAGGPDVITTLAPGSAAP